MKTHLAGIFLVAVAAAGCGSNPQFAPEPYADAGPPPPPLVVAPPPPAVRTGPCDQAQSLATSGGLLARGAAEAPGMKPEGLASCSVVAEGQVYSTPVFMLEQGYCYTFLGQSLPPVTAMEMELQADPAPGAMMPPAIAAMMQQKLLVSTETGERVSMATKQSCYQWPFPIPVAAKLNLKARAGSGPVAVQVFKKKKAF